MLARATSPFAAAPVVPFDPGTTRCSTDSGLADCVSPPWICESPRLHVTRSGVAHQNSADFARDTAELAGRIAGELERIGQPIGTADPMIAAIALHHGLELVTGNTAHFQRIQQIGYPLTLANWR